jgi:hypothetical protein
MFKRVISIIVLIPFVFLTSGCCTLMKGNRQLVSINSEPTGAKVKIDGLKGTTPYTADLSRGQDYVATISKEGYEDQQVQITKSFSAMAIFGNILWLLVGAVVDICTGSAYNLNPASVDVELEPA